MWWSDGKCMYMYKSKRDEGMKSFAQHETCK